MIVTDGNGDSVLFRCYVTGLVNNASIDWFFPWPEQALYAVASVFISPEVSSILWLPVSLFIYLTWCMTEGLLLLAVWIGMFTSIMYVQGTFMKKWDTHFTS